MHYKATSTLMDAMSTGLNVHCAATGTRAGVHVCLSPASEYMPAMAAWPDILNAGIRCQSLPRVWLLAKI